MFREKKARALIALFVRQSYWLDKEELMVLVALAERIVLSETTSLITGGSFTSTPDGVAVAEVLDMVSSNEPRPMWTWSMSRTAIASVLSDYEIDVARRVWDKYSHESCWSRDDLVATFPEWDPICVESRRMHSLRLEDIFMALGDTPARASERAQEIEYFEALDVQVPSNGSWSSPTCAARTAEPGRAGRRLRRP